MQPRRRTLICTTAGAMAIYRAMYTTTAICHSILKWHIAMIVDMALYTAMASEVVHISVRHLPCWSVVLIKSMPVVEVFEEICGEHSILLL